MPTYETEAPDGKALKPWEMDLEVVNETSTNSRNLKPWERDYSTTKEYSPPLKTVKDDYIVETAICSIIFLTIILALLIKSALKKEKEKQKGETPIDGITIIVRFIGLFLAMAYEYFKQELKKEGLYIGGFINAGAYMFFVYLLVWYRHKPKTINKEQEKPIDKPKKQKENKISKTQYFLALIYIFYEWIAKKVIGLICEKEQPRKQTEQIKYPIVKKLSLFVFIFLIFGYNLYNDFLYSFRRSIGLDRDITDILYIVLLIVFCYLSFRKQKDKKIDKILLKIETKLQKLYNFCKLHFIEICLAIIALSLLKIAF